MQDAWAAGARVGYLVAPNVLSYVNGGYSGSHWSGSTFLSAVSGAPVGDHTNSFNRNGWFIGGGVENNLNIFGITAPGWFMKTEYRSAFYNSKSRQRTGRWHQCPRRTRYQVQHLDPDHLDLAGLPLQLERPGGCQVLISAELQQLKSPGIVRGFFVPCVNGAVHHAPRRATIETRGPPLP